MIISHKLKTALDFLKKDAYECSCFELSELFHVHSFATAMNYNKTTIVPSYFYVFTVSVTAIALNASSLEENTPESFLKVCYKAAISE